MRLAMIMALLLWVGGCAREETWRGELRPDGSEMVTLPMKKMPESPNSPESPWWKKGLFESKPNSSAGRTE